MMLRTSVATAACLLALLFEAVRGGVGDPQLRTDHPWYPGELACSTFERLFETQADAYRMVVGAAPQTDEQKALAAWLWRNTHYWHGEEGAEDLWGEGFERGMDTRTREYWTGLFAHGFGLCGTTHSQWSAEMEALFGHNRGRGIGVAGHNAFEVWVTGGPYGDGKWVLLDHDLSTVVFNREGTALLSIPEVRADLPRMMDRRFAPEKQRGWLVCGLHPQDGSAYREYNTAEYLAGYSGVPPIVHLRRGETLRRYPEPGLDDGKTFVFWGRNYNTGGVPGPERSRTWVNQPDHMYRSQDGAGYKPGQARYANAVYLYRPDFSGPYREAVTDESGDHVTFEFYTPYIIAATPAHEAPWGIYDAGGRNGLVLSGNARCNVKVSTDQGRTWQDCGSSSDGMDLTDRVKGRRQYLIRFGAGARVLRDSSLTLRTVCQANGSVLPRLRDEATRVRFMASGRAVVSAGPNIDQARAHLVDGAFGTDRVTLELASPRHEPAVALYAAAHVQSGNPPDPAVKHAIEYSTDGGSTWRPIVEDWAITRRGGEPNDFWSQSFCWGSCELPGAPSSPVRVRFRNNGARRYARCELHLAYQTRNLDATRVTFDWSDGSGPHRAAHVFRSEAGAEAPVWELATGRGVRTRWVEFEPVPGE